MTTNEEQLRQKIKELEEQNDQLLEQLRDAREQLARAKDPRPVMRPSFVRVRRLAQLALFDLERHPHGGFILRMGSKSQWYKSLKNLWLTFTQDSWNLSDLIPESVPPRIARENAIFEDLLASKRYPIEEPLPKEESIIADHRPGDYNKKRIPPVKRDRELVKLCKQDNRDRKYVNPRLPHHNKPLLPKVEWWNHNLVPGY